MTKKPWTQEEMDLLSRMYPDHYAREIADLLGRRTPSVYCQARKMGLKCNPEKIRMTGVRTSALPNSIAHRFKEGHLPPNAGKKLPPEQVEKMRPTMFKKGQMPHNHREVGSERINVDGYREVKVEEPRKWRLKHRVIWEEANGPIPKGFNVQFRNHNPLDCRLENLYLISRVDQLGKENSMYARYPKELQEVIHLKGVVNRAIHKAQKHGK